MRDVSFSPSSRFLYSNPRDKKDRKDITPAVTAVR